MDEFASTTVATGGSMATVCLILVTVIALLLARKTDNFPVALLLVYWVLAQPIIQGFFVIHLPGLPFNLPPNRLLFFGLLAVLGAKLLAHSSRPQHMREHSPTFLPYLYGFIMMVILAIIINRNNLEHKKLLAIPLEPITFVMMFLVAKAVVTEKILRAVLYSVLIVALLNAVVAIYQSVGDAYFLRVGEIRSAFGKVFRSYGLFPTEYVLGSFQIMSVYVAIALFRGKFIMYPIVALLVVSVLTTFHRLDLIMLLFTGLIYMKFFSRRRYSLPFLLVISLFSSALVPAYGIFKSMGNKSSLVEERLVVDTLSGRLHQYALVIHALPDYPFGVGSYEAKSYQTLMIDAGHTKSVLLKSGFWSVYGLGVHNGFLGVAILYGILSMVLFLALLWKMLTYFYSRASRDQVLTIIPLFSVLVWLLSNTTNGVIVFRSYNVLIVALLCGVFVGAYQKGIIRPEKTIYSQTANIAEE